MRQAASQVAASLAAQPKYAAGIRTPLSAGGKSLVSADGRSALVTFERAGQRRRRRPGGDRHQRAVAAVQARHPDLRIAESGDASISQAINSSLNFSKAEADLGTDHADPAARRVRRAGRGRHPGAARADRADGGDRGADDRSATWLPVASSTFEVVVIIGMAVGVDYSLFYLRREREERAKGRSFPEALRIASRTSGRTIAGVRPDRDGRDDRRSSWSVAARSPAWRWAPSRWSASRSPARSPCCPRCWPGSDRARTRGGSRSSAAAGPPPGRPGSGRRWLARWSPGR